VSNYPDPDQTFLNRGDAENEARDVRRERRLKSLDFEREKGRADWPIFVLPKGGKSLMMRRSPTRDQESRQ
jgi:hypothetical protein